MDIEIVSEEESPVLRRMDVRFEIVYEGTTSFHLSVRDSLAAKLNKNSDEVVARELDTKLGMHKTTGYVKVYESPEFVHDVEQDHVFERSKTAGTEVEAEEA